jgi:hypothetical protein
MAASSIQSKVLHPSQDPISVCIVSIRKHWRSCLRLTVGKPSLTRIIHELTDTYLTLDCIVTETLQIARIQILCAGALPSMAFDGTVEGTVS